MAQVKLADGELDYSLQGPEDKPVLVLSNSLGTDRHMWDGQMAAFTEHFQVLRYDTRGHGRSLVTPGTYTIEQLGGDVLALLDALQVPLIVTSSHQGDLIQQQRLPWPCAWAMGHEGQGVGQAVAARAQRAVRIGQPGGEESLNVAAAAAICLHASAISAV